LLADQQFYRTYSCATNKSSTLKECFFVAVLRDFRASHVATLLPNPVNARLTLRFASISPLAILQIPASPPTNQAL